MMLKLENAVYPKIRLGSIVAVILKLHRASDSTVATLFYLISMYYL